MNVERKMSADESALCVCGAQIVPVDEKKEFWRLVNSGEVCSGGHWHKPAEKEQPVSTICNCDLLPSEHEFCEHPVAAEKAEKEQRQGEQTDSCDLCNEPIWFDGQNWSHYGGYPDHSAIPSASEAQPLECGRCAKGFERTKDGTGQYGHLVGDYFHYCRLRPKVEPQREVEAQPLQKQESKAIGDISHRVMRALFGRGVVVDNTYWTRWRVIKEVLVKPASRANLLPTASQQPSAVDMPFEEWWRGYVCAGNTDFLTGLTKEVARAAWKAARNGAEAARKEGGE